MAVLHPLARLAFFQAQGSGSFLPALLPIVAIFGIFWFLLIRPQQKRQKQWQQMVDALKTGDKVVTSGGLRGTVISLRDDAVQLRIPPDNLRLEVQRSAVVQVANDEKG